MAVGAEKPEIFPTIIIAATVDVINRQHEWLTIPNSFNPAKGATIRNPHLDHRAAQLICFFMLRERVALNKYLIRRHFARPAAMSVALVTHLA